MLRHIDQHGGGVFVYTHHLLREMLALDSQHQFLLLCSKPGLVSRYVDGERVRELVLSAPSALLWDQVAVRLVERREKVDLIFNPKYSLPLTANVRSVFVCHGLDWYVMPRASRWIDRVSHRYLVPRYADKANAIISVSESTRKHVIQYLGVPEERVHTVYHGVDEVFRQSISREDLERARQDHHLPERFFLYCGQIYPPKNFGRLVRAYARVGPERGIHLVVAGEHRRLCDDELALVEQLGISSWVVWAGWIEHQRLPAVYALAEALLMPSLYESCGLPILEAMSSGCPVVTSNRHGTLELSGNAAVLIDPENVDAIAQGMRRVLDDRDQRFQLIEAGRRHAGEFTWRRCAEQTLRVLERAGSVELEPQDGFRRPPPLSFTGHS